MNDITIIITSFKSGEKINNCLNSINNQCKVLLIENSNDIEFKKKIEKKFTNVECFLTGENLGYGKANNIGLKKTTTKYALILNPDAYLEKNTIENFLQSASEIPNFAIMAPYVQEEKNNNTQDIHANTKPKEVINVKGFAMFLNMIQFKDIGFFDENFFIYFEEIDLCKRLIMKNKKIYLVPSIAVKHKGGQSHDKSVDYEMELSRNWHWMWSTFNYHKKYKGFIFSFLVILPKLLSAIFKYIIFSLLFNKKKKDIYFHRYSGLFNAIIGKNSWYRPKV